MSAATGAAASAGTELQALLSLRGRTALLTGGSGAIGGAVAELLLQAGARVISVDRPGLPAPPGAESLPVDLADGDAVARLAAGLCEREPALHVLVHCAGITRDAVLWKLQPAQWREVLAVNLDSAFLLLHGLAPLLRRARGAGGVGASVVLVSSINGERGKFGQANYAASKAGLIALGKTAARELGRDGVRVNCVAPGLVDTPMTAGLPDEIRAHALAESLLGRAGRPQDVARAVLFLASDLAAHVTGQTLRVDGGQLVA